jgi:uncharacterized membrane protein
VILLLSAIAYYILQSLVIADHGPESALTKAMGLDYKGKLSPMIYAIAIPVAFYRPWISSGLYMLVALIWLVPDQRLERSIEGNGHSH